MKIYEKMWKAFDPFKKFYNLHDDNDPMLLIAKSAYYAGFVNYRNIVRKQDKEEVNFDEQCIHCKRYV